MEIVRNIKAGLATRTLSLTAVFLIICVTTAFAMISGEFFHATGNAKFCGSCHEMSPFVATWKNDVHGGNNTKGISADCATCHLPQSSVTAYSVVKAKNGLKEGIMHVFGAYSDKAFLDNLKNREQFVYESGCLSCHTNITATDKPASKNPRATEMHAHYMSTKGTAKELSCVSCHVTVGHNGEIRNHLIKDLEQYP